MVNSNILFANQPAESGPSNAFNITRAVSAMKDAPYQNQLLQAQVQGQQLSNKINQNQLTKEQAIMQLGDAATDALILQPILQSGDMNRVNMFLDQRVKKIQQRGGNPEDTLDLKQRLNSGATNTEQAQAELMGIVNAATQSGVIKPDASMNVPAGIQEFDYMTSGFTPEQIMDSKLVRAGLKPRADNYTPSPYQQGPVSADGYLTTFDPNTRSYVRTDIKAAAYDPQTQKDVSEAKGTGKFVAEQKKQIKEWDAFSSSFAKTYLQSRDFSGIPEIKKIINDAPGSSLSAAVQSGLSKIAGNTNALDAKAKIEQMGAILLQTVPYPPGTQAVVEQQMRERTIGNINDPNISVPTKIDLISTFLKTNEDKFRALEQSVGQKQSVSPNVQMINGVRVERVE